MTLFPHYNTERVRTRLYQMRKETAREKDKFGPEIHGKLLNNTYTRDVYRWKPEEHQLFVDLVKVHGRDYKTISEQIPGKNHRQVADHGLRTRLQYDRLPVDHPDREILACIKLGGDKRCINRENKVEDVHCDVQKVLNRQIKFIIQEAQMLQQFTLKDQEDKVMKNHTSVR